MGDEHACFFARLSLNLVYCILLHPVEWSTGALFGLDLILLRWCTEYESGLLAKSTLKALAPGDEILL